MMLKILLLSALVGAASGALGDCTLPSSLGNGIVGDASGTNTASAAACVAGGTLATTKLCDVKLGAGYVGSGTTAYACTDSCLTTTAALATTGCLANFYQSGGAGASDVVCDACEAGTLIVTANAASGATTCTPCATACEKCANAYYQDGGAQSGGSATCAACATGKSIATANTNDGTSSCSNCDTQGSAGTTKCSTESTTVCATAVAAHDHFECTAADPGYSIVRGVATAVNCPTGSSGTVPGTSGTGSSSGCTTDPGYKGAVTKTTTLSYYTTTVAACTPATAGDCIGGCAIGFYQSAGTDNAGTGIVCTACTAGKRQAADTPDNTQDTACANDCAAIGNTAKLACGATYTCTTNADTRIVAAPTDGGIDQGLKCKVGSFFTAGASGAKDTCITCSELPTTGTTKLATCTACSKAGAAGCSAGTCAAGYHTFVPAVVTCGSTADAKCTQCVAGNNAASCGTNQYLTNKVCDATYTKTCQDCAAVANAVDTATFTCDADTGGNIQIATPASGQCKDGYKFAAGAGAGSGADACNVCTTGCTHCLSGYHQVAAAGGSPAVADCDQCAAGEEIATAAVGSAATTCADKRTTCASNEYTASNICVACPSGKTRAAGDLTTATDTYVCGSACAAASTSAAGTVEASIALVALAIAATLV